MPNNVSGYGLSIFIKASRTFPIGFTLTEFADDADPLDMPPLTITESAMGLNGQKIVWTVANPIPMTLNLIAGSDDDTNMRALFSANRAGRNKASVGDEITSIITYASGMVTTVSGGSCDVFVPTPPVSSAGRLKSQPYTLSFENIVSIQLPVQ